MCICINNFEKFVYSCTIKYPGRENENNPLKFRWGNTKYAFYTWNCKKLSNNYKKDNYWIVYCASRKIVFQLGGHKMNSFALQGSTKCTLWPYSRNSILCSKGKKVILRVWSFKTEQSAGNNRTCKINVFSMLHAIIFYWRVKKCIFLPCTGQ